MHYKKLNTKDNVNFEDPLTEQISFRVTSKEKGKYEVLARENEISVPELMRNLARDYSHEYAISPELKKNLIISNKIEAILVKNRIISSRKPSNLSNICEIFSDFEAFLGGKLSNNSDSELRFRLSDFREITNLVILHDPDLFLRLKPQMNRIMKNKRIKALELKKGVNSETNMVSTIVIIEGNNIVNEEEEYIKSGKMRKGV